MIKTPMPPLIYGHMSHVCENLQLNENKRNYVFMQTEIAENTGSVMYHEKLDGRNNFGIAYVGEVCISDHFFVIYNMYTKFECGT